MVHYRGEERTKYNRGDPLMDGKEGQYICFTNRSKILSPVIQEVIDKRKGFTLLRGN